MTTKIKQQESENYSLQFRLWLLGLGAVATAFIAVILLYGSALVSKSVALEEQWSINNRSAAERSYALSEIQAAFGYGGFIHNFKNLVLRKDVSRIILAEEDLVDTYRAIEHYLSMELTEHERKDVSRIVTTVDGYREALDNARKLLTEDKNISSLEIDRVVRIDDRPALEALEELAEHNRENSEQSVTDTSLALVQSIDLIYLGFLFVPLVVVVFLVIALFLRRLMSINQKLSEVQRYANELYEAAPDPTLVISENGLVVQANQRAEQLLGYDANEILGITAKELVEYRDQSFIGEDGHGSGYENNCFIVWTKDGNDIPVEITISPIEQQGSKDFIATLRDISKKRVIDRELRYGREMLNIAQEIASIGSWDWDLVNDELHWSDEMYRIFGLEPEDNKTDYELYLKFIHRDDREPVVTAINEAVILDKRFEQEYRIIRPDREQRILEGCGEVVRDDTGKAIRMVGTVHDITEFKKAQYELALSDNVFNHAAEAIIVTDSQNRILKVNNAFTRITQYTLDEVLMKGPEEVMKSFKHESGFYDEMWSELNSKGEWSGELWNKRKDGELFPTYQNIKVVKDSHDHIVQHISVFTDITEKKRAEESIRYLAHFDQLTGLHNRVLFKDRLEHAVLRARRNKGNVSLLFIDLDRFKYVNDTLGHDAGDQLLIRVSQILKECVRAQDTVSRLGGDEFTVILEDIAQGEDSAIVANKIIGAIEKPFTIDNQEVVIGSSIGIAVFPDNAETPEELVKNADIAMYYAKESGRNQHQFYTKELAEQSTNKFFMESRLRRAIENNEFEVYYQPQVNIEKSQITGAEALIRWNDPEHGIISPVAFIPIAEESGLIEPIGLWILQTACKQAAKWCQAIDHDFCISVNLSSRQLAAGNIFESVESVLKESGLSAANLELEITESAIMDNPESGIMQLEKIREMGISIAIDDFGTGYSSLSYLKRLPITRVKIDRSFLKEAHVNKDDGMIVNAIIVMSKSLNLDVIAEGVEHEEHLEYLKSHGCNDYQGFYYSKPVPAKEFEVLLQLDD